MKWLIIILVLASCSPQQRLSRLSSRYPMEAAAVMQGRYHTDTFRYDRDHYCMELVSELAAENRRLRNGRNTWRAIAIVGGLGFLDARSR